MRLAYDLHCESLHLSLCCLYYLGFVSSMTTFMLVTGGKSTDGLLVAHWLFLVVAVISVIENQT